MGANTAIEWTQATWNPIVGCSVISPGCTNCYAMRMAARLEAVRPGGHYAGTTQRSKAGTVWIGKVAMAPDHILTAPLRRRKPTTYFVNSMGDLFHEAVPDEWIDRVFAVMALSPQHTFQLLTKRSARMREYLRSRGTCIPIGSRQEAERLSGEDPGAMRHPLPNVWLGVSTEDQERADERVPALLVTPAAVRFVSAEPLLGVVDLTSIAVSSKPAPGHFLGEKTHCARHLDALRGVIGWSGQGLAPSENPETSGLAAIDWVIVGGESGPGARPMHPDWARALRDQCMGAGVPFFFKQWGGYKPGSDFEFDAKTVCLDRAGRVVPSPARTTDFPPGATAGDGWSFMRRVGKTRAGRLLDGVSHDALPGAAGAG